MCLKPKTMRLYYLKYIFTFCQVLSEDAYFLRLVIT